MSARPVSTIMRPEQTMLGKINEHRNSRADGVGGFAPPDQRRTTIYQAMQAGGSVVGQVTAAGNNGSVVGVSSRPKAPSSPKSTAPPALMDSKNSGAASGAGAGASPARQSRAAPAAAAPSPAAQPAPGDMNQAMVQFDQAKKEAQRRVRDRMSAKSRLINAFADLTVVLLTRAMMAGAHDRVEVRIYKKPANLGGGNYAVAEYRDVKSKADKKLDKKQQGVTGNTPAPEQTSDDDFIVLTCGELLPGEAGLQKDVIENWRQFADVISHVSMWWRFCMAVHKRIGWKVQLERGILNVIDSRMLGFVTLKISNFI